MSFDEFHSSLLSPTTGFVLKLGASLATAGFGLLGIGATTRTVSGKLTRSGWVAFVGIVVGGILAVGSCIYDFSSGQEAERQLRSRTQQLLTSVRRGIYPMHGIKVSVEIELNSNIEPVRAFKDNIRKLAASDRRCKTLARQLQCNGFSSSGASVSPDMYEVLRESPLFPRHGTDLRRLIDYTYVHVAFLRDAPSFEESASPKMRQAQYMGRFFAQWHRDGQGLPVETLLRYSFSSDSLTLEVRDLVIPDAESNTAGLYSLVDFLPGYIRLIPNLSEDPMCGAGPATGVCTTELIVEYSKGLKLFSFEIMFPYPKALRAYESEGTSCVAEPGNGLGTGLAVDLPFDVDGVDSLGNVVSRLPLPLPGISICELTQGEHVLPDPTQRAFRAAVPASEAGTAASAKVPSI